MRRWEFFIFLLLAPFLAIADETQNHQYDAVDRLIVTTQPNALTITQRFDATGNLVTRVKRAKQPAILLHAFDFDGAVVQDIVSGLQGEIKAGARIDRGELVLDGVSGYVQFPIPLIPSEGSFSVSLKVTRLQSQSGVFTEYFSQGITGGKGFYLGSNGNSVLRVGDQWQNTGVSPADIGRQVRFAITVDTVANESKLFMDGAEVARVPFAIQNSPFEGTPTRLGRQFEPYEEYFQGKLDDFRVYSGVLTLSEINLLR